MFVGRRREKFVTGRAVFYVGVCTSVSEPGAVSQKKSMQNPERVFLCLVLGKWNVFVTAG